MKKSITSIILMASLAVLTACSDAPESSETSVGGAEVSAGTPDNSIAADNNEKEDLQIKAENNSVPAAVTSGEHRYFQSAVNVYDDGLTYRNSSGINMYLDFATMSKTVLCARPNCMHNSSDCIAKIMGATPMICGEYIYYFDPDYGVKETSGGREFYMDSVLKRVSLDTSEIEEICTFHDCVASAHGSCELVGNMLYFVGDDMCVQEDEYGGINFSSAGGTHFLCSVNIDTGEYTNYGSIYDDDKEYEGAECSSNAKVMGFYNGRLYVQYSFMKEYVEDYDIDVNDKYTMLTFEFDPAAKTLTQSDLPCGADMGDNYYLYSNYPENSSTVIVDGREYTVDDFNVNKAGKYLNGKMFFYHDWADVQTGEMHSFGEEHNNWRVLTMYGDSYIICDEFLQEFEKVTENELLTLN